MSRGILNPDLIDGNSLSSSFDSDFDQEFAPQTYPNTTIYEQSTFYASPLASNPTLDENIVNNIVLSAAGTQFDVSIDFDINVGKQLIDTSSGVEYQLGVLRQHQYQMSDLHMPFHPQYIPNTDVQPMAQFVVPASQPPRPRRHVCTIASCRGASFSRAHELRRHNASRHDFDNPRFWCPIGECGRSRKDGGRGFPRKDKMVDHLMRVHGDKVSSAS
ncbi:unnamed protein product [Alternaria sp. RS040]